MPQAVDIYRWLMSAGERTICEGFDAHVVASAFALAVAEVAERPLPESLGLPLDEVRELVVPFFPHAEQLLNGAVDVPLEFSEEERRIGELLFSGSSERTSFERRLAAVIARRAQEPNHLWQDMGLRHRRELSWLLSAHFEPIANRNHNDMKWKKYLYRAICRDTGYSLCIAPTCGECDEYDKCFGDEAGDCLLQERTDAAGADASQR